MNLENAAVPSERDQKMTVRDFLSSSLQGKTAVFVRVANKIIEKIEKGEDPTALITQAQKAGTFSSSDGSDFILAFEEFKTGNLGSNKTEDPLATTDEKQIAFSVTFGGKVEAENISGKNEEVVPESGVDLKEKVTALSKKDIPSVISYGEETEEVFSDYPLEADEHFDKGKYYKSKFFGSFTKRQEQEYVPSSEYLEDIHVKEMTQNENIKKLIKSFIEKNATSRNKGGVSDILNTMGNEKNPENLQEQLRNVRKQLQEQEGNEVPATVKTPPKSISTPAAKKPEPVEPKKNNTTEKKNAHKETIPDDEWELFRNENIVSPKRVQYLINKIYNEGEDALTERENQMAGARSRKIDEELYRKEEDQKRVQTRKVSPKTPVEIRNGFPDRFTPVTNDGKRHTWLLKEFASKNTVIYELEEDPKIQITVERENYEEELNKKVKSLFNIEKPTPKVTNEAALEKKYNIQPGDEIWDLRSGKLYKIKNFSIKNNQTWVEFENREPLTLLTLLKVIEAGEMDKKFNGQKGGVLFGKDYVGTIPAKVLIERTKKESGDGVLSDSDRMERYWEIAQKLAQEATEESRRLNQVPVDERDYGYESTLVTQMHKYRNKYYELKEKLNPMNNLGPNDKIELLLNEQAEIQKRKEKRAEEMRRIRELLTQLQSKAKK